MTADDPTRTMLTGPSLAFIPYPPGPVPEPLDPPPRRYNTAVTHILAWWVESRLRWLVGAGDARGEVRGVEEYRTQKEAIKAAGRMAKRTGAKSLLVCADGQITRQDYKR